MLTKIKGWIRSYQSIILFVVVWEIIARAGIFPERLFPSFVKVIQTTFHLVVEGPLWGNLGDTMFRLGVGFVLATVFGVMIGLMMSRYQIFDDLMQPIFSVGYPIPRVALYPIFVFIFGIGSASKIVLIFLECIFPIVINTYFGAKRVNKFYIWSGQNMGASNKEMFWKIILPATMPAIFTGLRIALPLALVIAVLTEMISSTSGMGYLLSFMSSSLRQDQVLAGVIIISIVGFLLDRLIGLLRSKYVYWH